MKTFLKVHTLSAPFRWAIYPLAVCVAAVAVVAAPRPEGDLPSDTELAAAAQSITVKQKAVDARLAYKESLVRDLVAGNGSLREAAELFLAANAESEHSLDVLRMQYPGLSDLACTAKSVMSFTEGNDLPPGEKGRFRERLACEFEALAGE